jgi:hypothetical protein
MAQELNLPHKGALDCFDNREYLLKILRAPDGYIGKMNHCDKAAAGGGALAMFALLAPHADLLLDMARDAVTSATNLTQDAEEDLRTINRILDKYRD